MDYEKAMEIASGEPQSQEEQERDKRKISFGKFQQLMLCLFVWAITSANCIIYPLAYFELMPKFTC